MRKTPLTVAVSAPGADKPLATGRIAFLDNAVDQTTGTIKVRAIFDNAGVALWPGQFVTVRVKLYDQENAIVVPSRALQTGPNGQFGYVIKLDITAAIPQVVVTRPEGDPPVPGAGTRARTTRAARSGTAEHTRTRDGTTEKSVTARRSTVRAGPRARP